MRFCVIGNSHVGMLRAAVREPGADATSLTFFAKAGQGLERATIRGSVISAEDPALAEAQARFGMPAKTDVAEFDAVVFVAGTASVFDGLKILLSHRVSGWPSSGAALSEMPLISEAAYVAALADRARAGVSYQFAQALRSASDVPMFLVPQPFPGEQVLGSEKPRDFIFRRVQSGGDGVALIDGLARALAQALSEIDNLVVLQQPKDTVAQGFLTAAAFTRDAVRVDGNTPQHGADFLHVGPAFGTLVLARVASALGGQGRI